MKQSKNNAFTLIELIATLVIMAIIALIVTPLVMNIIRSARTASDKRSIDAYGRSIELAIAGYLMDNGSFPTSIEQLTIEYSGDEVVCTTTQLNNDSSIYLAGCTVGGRNVDGYTYGKGETTPSPSYTAYSVGDEVTYNGVDYYVMEDSSTSDTTVKLLKKTPLTVAEVNTYGVGIVNKYIWENGEKVPEEAYESDSSGIKNGYGGMAYYNSETCGNINSNETVLTGCNTSYASSDIKKVVDAWSAEKTNENDIQEARLITLNELVSLGYSLVEEGWTRYEKSQDTPEWLYGNYSYWTMSSGEEYREIAVMAVSYNSRVNAQDMFRYGNWNYVVRPVIELNKSALN